MIKDDYFKEIREILKDLSLSQKKTDEAQKKTDEQLRKTDEQLRKTDEEIKAMAKKTDEEIRKVNKMVAGISDGFGRMTEGFAIASIEKIFKKQKMYIDTTFSRAKKRKNGKELELDLLNLVKGENGKNGMAIAVEVKTYLKIQDVDDFIKDMLMFYEFFEEYRDKELIGAIAFMNCAKEAKKYAEKNGFYLLSCSEDLMKLVNKKGFKPNLFRYDKKSMKKDKIVTF